LTQQPPLGQGPLIHEVSRSHSTIFEKKKVIKHKVCALIFPAIFVRNISNSKHNSARCQHKCMQSSCQILIKIEFS
jgi:hypothetical protein